MRSVVIVLLLLLCLVVVSHSSQQPSTKNGAGHPLKRKRTRRMRRGPHADGSDSYKLTRAAVDYYLPVFVGNPPVLVHLQIDTGSSVTVIPSADCLAAPAAFQCSSYFDVPYNVSLSTTSRFVDFQRTTLAFADGSEMNGTWVEDKVSLTRGSATNSDAEEMSFVYVTRINARARQQLFDMGGILGLGPHAPFAAADYVRLLNTSRFTLALGESPPMLYLGPPAAPNGESFHRAKLRKRPSKGRTSRRNELRDEMPSAYMISASSLVFGSSRSTSAELGDVILDSGTAGIALPRKVFDGIINEILIALCPANATAHDDVCSQASHLTRQSEAGEGFVSDNFYDQVVHRLPPLTLFINVLDPQPPFFEGYISIDVLPERYISKVPCAADADSEGQCLMLLLRPVDELGGLDKKKGPLTLLGDPFMSSVRVHFDRLNNWVGFAPSKLVVTDGTTPTNLAPSTAKEGATNRGNDTDRYLIPRGPLVISFDGHDAILNVWELMVIVTLCSCATTAFVMIRCLRHKYPAKRPHNAAAPVATAESSAPSERVE